MGGEFPVLGHVHRLYHFLVLGREESIIGLNRLFLILLAVHLALEVVHHDIVALSVADYVLRTVGEKHFQGVLDTNRQIFTEIVPLLEVPGLGGFLNPA